MPVAMSSRLAGLAVASSRLVAQKLSPSLSHVTHGPFASLGQMQSGQGVGMHRRSIHNGSGNDRGVIKTACSLALRVIGERLLLHCLFIASDMVRERTKFLGSAPKKESKPLRLPTLDRDVAKGSRKQAKKEDRL